VLGGWLGIFFTLFSLGSHILGRLFKFVGKGNIVFTINWIRLFLARNQYFAVDKMAWHYTGAPDWVQCSEKPLFAGDLQDGIESGSGEAGFHDFPVGNRKDESLDNGWRYVMLANCALNLN